MVLVIDNYDSFTYNLVQYLGELGAKVVVRRNDETSIDELRGLAHSRIVISPGPGRPEQAGVSLDVIKEFGPRMPMLGVCLGHQAIGLAFGGEVVRAPVPIHGKTSTVEHDGRGVFAGITRRFRPAAITRWSSTRRRCRRISRSPRAPRKTGWSWACATRRGRFTACSFTRNRS